MAKGFTFIDLFAGIGGFRVAFEAVGGECVFTSEIDKFAIQTYRANFTTEHAFAGDIREVDAADIPDHDMLFGGFPCQPFSVSGVSRNNSLGRPHGFDDATRGTLFFEIARIIREKRPRVFVLENVKNLLSHDKGRTFQVIRDVLEQELGYHVQVRVFDAQYFVPQKRERTFIVGFREPTDFRLDAIQMPARRLVLGDILEEDVDPKYTLSDKMLACLEKHAARHAAKGNGFGYGLVGPDDVTRTLQARYYKDGSEILVRQEGKNPRRLTPRECSRLMGFDTPQGSKWVIPVSDSQAYKQFGNAVVVPLVKHLARHIVQDLP